MTHDSDSGPLDADERAELQRLRDEVSTLRSRLAESGAAVVAPTRPPRHMSRRIGVAALLVLVAVFAIGSVTSRFVRSQILDTDRYITTVAPLGEDPAIQAEVTNQITDEIFARVDIDALTAEALAAISSASNLTENAPRVNRLVTGLSPVLARQTKDFVHDTVSTFVQSQQFEDLWIQANRRAHGALVSVVTGNYGISAVGVDRSGTVSISLATIIDNVRTTLTDRGFTIVENIPTIDKQFVLFQSPELVRAQRTVDALDKASAILPWLGVACAAAAVALAPRGRRLRTLSLAGLSVALGMLVLALAVLVARAIYLDDIPADVLSPDAAAAVVDTVLVPLRTSVRAVAVAALVVAVGAYLIGGSSSALAVRRGFGRAVDAVRSPVHAHTPNSVERWAHQIRVPLRATIIGVAALLLVFWHYPTGLVVFWIVLGALLALLLLEILARPIRAHTDVGAHVGADADAGDTPNSDEVSAAT